MSRFSDCLRRCCAGVLAVLLLAALMPCAHAETGAERTVRVGVSPVKGFSEMDEDGNWYGLIIDYLNEISKYTGWIYEYVEVEGDQIIDGFLDHKYDLMGGTYYIAGLEEVMAYPHYNTGYDKSVLLARWDESSLRSYQLDSLDGKTIGVAENAVENIRRLEEFLQMNGVECELRYYSRKELRSYSLTGYLEKGEVDLILGNSTDNTGEFRAVAVFDAQPHYIVTHPEEQELLDGLNMAMERIIDSNPKFSEERYMANFPDRGTADVNLNEEERAYIREKGTLTVAVPESHHPLFCLNSPEDFHDGITHEMLKAVEAFSGLQFEYVYTEDYIQALELVQQGGADMAGFFLGDERQAQEMGLALTKAYVTLGNAVVRNKSVGYPGDNLSCAVLEGRPLPKDIQVSDIYYCSDLGEALKKVNRGEVDFIYGLSARLEQAIQRDYLSNVVPVSLFDSSTDVSFVLPKPAPAELLTILNKSITHMTEEERENIANRNLTALGGDRFSLSSLVYSNPVLFVTVVTLFLALLVAIVLLSSRARVRAAVMRSELERAEAENRAKSDFLSRMSHEIRTPMNAVLGLVDLTSMMEDVPERVRSNLSKIRSSSRYLLSLINDILDMSRIEGGMMTIGSEPFSLLVILNELESMMGAEAGRRGLDFQAELDIQDTWVVGDPIRLRQVLTNLLSNAFKFTPAGGNVRLRAAQLSSDDHSAVYFFSVKDTGAGITDEDQKRIFNAFEQAGDSRARSQGTGLGLPISRSIVSMMRGELKVRSVPGQGSEFYFSVTLPLSDSVQEQAVTESSASLPAGARILLAEDNELNAEIATELLKIQGAQVRWAKNGREAVEQFDHSSPGEIQAILMDLQMPEMNGLEAAQAIRKLDRPDAATVPILAMTANTFKEDAEAAERAGMDGFIAKPLDVSYLYGILSKMLRGER